MPPRGPRLGTPSTAGIPCTYINSGWPKFEPLSSGVPVIIRPSDRDGQVLGTKSNLGVYAQVGLIMGLRARVLASKRVKLISIMGVLALYSIYRKGQHLTSPSGSSLSDGAISIHDQEPRASSVSNLPVITTGPEIMTSPPPLTSPP